MPRLFTIVLLIVTWSTAAWAQTMPAEAPASTGKVHALIVGGTSGSPMYARHYKDRIDRFYKLFGSSQPIVLSDDSSLKSGPATSESIQNAIQQIASKASANDQFVLIILGHGAAENDRVTLSLAGPDLQAKSLGDWLKSIQCKSQIVFNFSASSGDAAKFLAAKDRVLITSNSPTQVNDSDFAEFVLEELESAKTDNLLDIYNRATKKYAQWVVHHKHVPEEGAKGWHVEGKSAARISKKLYDHADVEPDRKFVNSPASVEADKEHPVVNDSSPFWIPRRVITDYPALDDRGTGLVSAITDKGFADLKAEKEGETGFVAGKTVLGKP